MKKPDKQQVFSVSNAASFTKTALQVFKYQATHCLVYKEFIQGLNINPASIKNINDIPFLPIEFFKSQAVVTSHDDIEVTFTSSGTTGMITSRHHVTDASWYTE